MDRILGQPAALDALSNQLATERVHHAQVFHGPAGVGKFTTAIAFARELLCHNSVTDLHGNVSACGHCASCKLFDTLGQADDSDDPTAALRSAHPDLHIITKELALFSDDKQTRDSKQSNIPLNVLKENLIQRVGLSPTMDHGKVFVVDEAELIDDIGQNALLKVLEEPPENTYLVLITSKEHRLLPTIRSRCQRVAFGPLEDTAVSRWLNEHQAELDEPTAKWVVGFAQGSLGRASLAVRFELVQWGTSVLSPIQRLAKSGRPEPQLGAAISECVDGFAVAWVAAHKNASKLAANRRAAALMGSMISNYARRRMASVAQQCDPETPGDSEPLLQPWLGVISAVTEFEFQLNANVNLKLCCEGLAMAIHGALLGVAA